MSEPKDEKTLAAMVRNAVDELNKALAEAARRNLGVELDAITHQNIGEEARQFYTARIFKRL
jgi:arginine utilization protein RocB